MMMLTGAGRSSQTPGWSPVDLATVVGAPIVSNSVLWQDAAKTVPAIADGDPVRVMVDSVVGGLEWTAPSAGTRPILRNSGGKWVLQFDGVDDYLDATISTFGYAAVAANFASTLFSSYNCLLSCHSNIFRGDGPGGHNWRMQAVELDGPFGATCRVDGVLTTELGDLTTWHVSDGYCAPIAAIGAMNIGREQGGAVDRYWQGMFAGTIIVSADPGSTDRDRCAAYLATKMP